MALSPPLLALLITIFTVLIAVTTLVATRVGTYWNAYVAGTEMNGAVVPLYRQLTLM